jgi:integration host factor subunit beta
MTKADLTREISDRLDIPLKEAKIVLDTILDGMARALHAGDRIEIRGFGGFASRIRNSRKGRNPTTGAGVDVPRKRVPIFKASAELKALVNGLGKSLSENSELKEAQQEHGNVG